MTLRLIDLPKISGKVIDVKGVMSEVIGFRKYWFFKKQLFNVALRKAMFLIREGRDTDISELDYNPKCNIRRPSLVDNICFKAMMELQSTIGNSNEDSDVVEVMSSVIAIACYQANVSKKYNSESNKYKEFKKKIQLEPLTDMVGLYNWICKTTNESQMEWKKRFMSVQVDNEDLVKAGGDRANQFNVLNSIKHLIQDFNCSYDEAWQMSYSLTQTNSYAKATDAHIQDNLRILKEHKMRAERGAKRT